MNENQRIVPLVPPVNHIEQCKCCKNRFGNGKNNGEKNFPFTCSVQLRGFNQCFRQRTEIITCKHKIKYIDAARQYDLPAIDDRLRGNYLLYGPRLYELKHPPRQYTPKRYRSKDTYAGKGVLQIFFEVFFGESQMHRLYLYYCYQLGILPKKQQPRINRPELERIWKDTERILAEHTFVRDHKFPSLQAIVDYRKGLSRQIDALAAQRAEIVKQMRRKDAPPELADQRMALTCKIAELRKEDKIAEGAIKRIQRTRESNRIDRENRMPLHPRPRRRRREQERE